MKWILEHLQVIILVAGAIAYWFNQRKREKEGMPADYDEDGVPENRPKRPEFDPATMDADEAERTRRVQEEIRRKIAGRRGQALQPPVPNATDQAPRIPAPARREAAPPPVFQDPVAEMLKEIQRRFSPETAAPPPIPVRSEPEPIDREMLERQRALEEQLRQLEAEKRAIQARAAKAASANPAMALVPQGALAASGNKSGASWLAELRDPNTARRAIVLREIMGSPVGLR